MRFHRQESDSNDKIDVVETRLGVRYVRKIFSNRLSFKWKTEHFDEAKKIGLTDFLG